MHIPEMLKPYTNGATFLEIMDKMKTTLKRDINRSSLKRVLDKLVNSQLSGVKYVLDHIYILDQNYKHNSEIKAMEAELSGNKPTQLT